MRRSAERMPRVCVSEPRTDMTQIAATSGTTNVGLLSVGVFRPERVVTNDELCQDIESSNEWIYSRTGIKTRRFAADEESATSMAIEAGRRALSIASLSGTDIDGVIVATSTHFLQTPASAPVVASELGAKGVLAFDISAGCAGFGYALGVAADMIRGGSADAAGGRHGETVAHGGHAGSQQLLHIRRRR